MIDCECSRWARVGYEMILDHHPRCEKASKNEMQRLLLIERLVSGMEEWASNEDGIPDFCFDAYQEACNLLGRRKNGEKTSG